MRTAVPLVVHPAALVPVKPSVSGNGLVAEAVAGREARVAPTTRALASLEMFFRIGFTPQTVGRVRLILNGVSACDQKRPG